MFQRIHYQALMTRIEEPRRFIQVISGPRQVGKSTLVEQLLTAVNCRITPFQPMGLSIPIVVG
jgi:uncharacterized protein